MANKNPVGDFAKEVAGEVVKRTAVTAAIGTPALAGLLVAGPVGGLIGVGVGVVGLIKAGQAIDRAAKKS